MKSSRLTASEIGPRLAGSRLSRNVTQSMPAVDAGIGFRTLRRLEAWKPSTLDTFLRVAIALELGEAILDAIPNGQIRPIERVSRSGSECRRARPSPKSDQDQTWIWGDDLNDTMIGK